MSASLVGSEMCIRDRWRCGRPARSSGDSRRCRPPLRALISAGPARAPVSYTHLTLPTICSV
eukprot:5731573-Alexandrium_andersonii.AAC.1